MTFQPATDDQITFSVYSDLFKDRNGFRPRWPITLQAAEEYIANCSDDDIDWEAEHDLELELREMEIQDEIYQEAYRKEQLAIDRDFGFEAWQIQAARLPTVKEQWILDY